MLSRAAIAFCRRQCFSASPASARRSRALRFFFASLSVYFLLGSDPKWRRRKSVCRQVKHPEPIRARKPKAGAAGRGRLAALNVTLFAVCLFYNGHNFAASNTEISVNNAVLAPIHSSDSRLRFSLRGNGCLAQAAHSFITTRKFTSGTCRCDERRRTPNGTR